MCDGSAHNSWAVRIAIFAAWVAGCAYPEFGFVPDAGAPADASATVDMFVGEDTAAAEDTEKPVDTTPESADPCASCMPAERCLAGKCAPHPSCDALHTAGPTLKSGVYTVDPDGAGAIAPFAVYCDIVDDAGWTLALKLDGTKKTFAYDAALWTNDATLNPTATALDTTEAKLASFHTMPVKAIRAGMLEAGAIRYLTITVASASLRALFSGMTTATTAGRSQWEKLLGDPRMQQYCNAEGINREFPETFSARARLGVFGNNENNCGSPDSYIAFGAGFTVPHACVGPDPGIVVGNYNPLSCGGSAGNERATAVFGYLFLR